MREWLRRVDPSFYFKEPHLLQAGAQIPRYTEEAQAEVRLTVLSGDRVVLVATALAAVSAYAAATGFGTLAPRANWLTLWAFASLAVGVTCALPWWPRPAGLAMVRRALAGIVLIALPVLWTRVDLAIAGIAALVGATILAARGRARIPLFALAAGVLLGVRVPSHLLFVAPLVAVVGAGAGLLGIGAVARVWQRRPQVLPWAAFATLLLVFAYTLAFNAPLVTAHMPAEFAAVAVAYLAVCVVAGRIRRAELVARPDGVISLPQSIVPLLDRSHDHAIVCWLA